MGCSVLISEGEIGRSGPLLKAIARDALGCTQVHQAKLAIEQQNEQRKAEYQYPEHYIADEPDTFHEPLRYCYYAYVAHVAHIALRFDMLSRLCAMLKPRMATLPPEESQGD